MTGPPETASFPSWWFDRAWNLNQVSIIIAVPYDTVYRWMQLIQSTGLFFGERRGREIMFDAHELYAFRVLTSFYRAGIPVGPAQVRAVAHFCFGHDGAPTIPEGCLIQEAPESQFAVDAVRIFRAVVAGTDPEVANAEQA